MESWVRSPETETFTIEREWTVEGVPVLTAKLSLPRPVDRSGRIARRIDRFYQLQGRSYLHYCEGWLFPRAAEAFRQAVESSAPLCCHTAELTYCVTCTEHGVWSLWTQMRETAGAKRTAVRRGDTWSLVSGYPIPLSAFFPRRFPVRRTLLQYAGEEIQRQQEAGISRYHDAWRQELRRSFNRENFYITPEGLRFFWQMNAVAPPIEGFPTFSLSFSEDGCRWPLAGDVRKT